MAEIDAHKYREAEILDIPNAFIQTDNPKKIGISNRNDKNQR